MTDGITVESLMKEHASRPRYKNIAAVFYRAGFIESWGRGIKKMCKAFMDAGLPPPEFDEVSNGTRITIQRTKATSIAQGRNAGALKSSGPLNGPLNDPLNGPLKTSLFELISKFPGINRKVLIENTGAAERTVTRNLSELEQAGRIVRRGSKKTGGYYIVTETES